ncbi:hypothetical protein OVA24_00710 [Luteolibacter sp. SL250]|uniref:hypothetical protein n=1 Tax=Luteolibacter sp. SL250 TaxID=2995170 RepID=UPI00226E1C26|nr:hypothetical protein [Luteolibacter sp. SL250]WAC19897.1 hypothetical protein OVA24_00710 [Luteolibacter sp. SL250]
MKPILKSAAAIALLAAGVLAGRSLNTDTASGPVGKAPPPRESRNSGTGTSHQQAAANDVEQLRQRLAQARRDPGGHAGELARLGVPALKELAMRAEEEVRSASQAGGSPDTRRDLLVSVIGELHDRLGNGVLEWAASLEEGPGRQVIFEKALLLAVRTDPATAGPWLKDFRRDYPDQRTDMISQAAVTGAISRSAGEFLQVIQDIASVEDLGYSDVLRTGYADDFDFAAAAKGLPGSRHLFCLLIQWAGRDPDELWAALKSAEDLGDKSKRSNALSAVALGAVSKLGESAGAEWTVSRLQELPENERAKVAESLAYSTRDRDTIIATLGKLEGSARTGFLSAFNYSDVGEDTRLDVMASLPREDLVGMVGQQRAASRMNANSHMGQAWMDDARTRSEARFTKMNHRFAFTPEELSRIESAELPEE